MGHLRLLVTSGVLPGAFGVGVVGSPEHVRNVAVGNGVLGFEGSHARRTHVEVLGRVLAGYPGQFRVLAVGVREYAVELGQQPRPPQTELLREDKAQAGMALEDTTEDELS